MLLRQRLGTARRIAIVGIGDEHSGFDRIGMLVARQIDGMHIPGVRVFFAGIVPESMTGPIRTFQPDHVILADAADMGASPGTIAVIDPERIIGEHFSTHALPLSAVMEFIEHDAGTTVTLLGIQPGNNRNATGLSFEGEELLHRNLAELVGVLRERCG
jgi:hydrogenase 3 maturation protease